MRDVDIPGVVARTALVAALMLGACQLSAAEPASWAQYRSSRYMSGQGVSDNPDRRQRLAEAESDALAALARSVRTHVTSKFETLRREDPQKYEEVTQVHNSSTSMIEVSGVEPVLHYEDGDTLHALAYINREKAKQDHYALATDLSAQIHQTLDAAARLASASRRQDALSAYADVYPLLERLEDALAVLLVVGGAPPDMPFSRPAIEEEVANLEDAPVHSLKDATQVLLSRLDRSGAVGSRVQVRAFTYARSDFASPFSHHLHQLLASDLSGRVVEGTKSFRAKGTDYAREAARQSNAETALFGTYQEVGDSVYLYARVVDIETGQRVAAADVAIPKTLVVQANLELKPENFLQALEDAGHIASSEVLSSAIRLELWTDHGRDGLLFQEDDVYHVYVRANRPCTIRLLYHLADGTRVVMHDDYPIASHMVNQGVQIGNKFRVVAPFGAETMQAFAYVGDPPPLRTRQERIGGQMYTLVDESLASAMSNYKGFVHEEAADDADGEAKHATVQMHLTTVP